MVDCRFKFGVKFGELTKFDAFLCKFDLKPRVGILNLTQDAVKLAALLNLVDVKFAAF